MKCPVCKGKNLGNPPSNIGGSFNMPCKTCGGTGEVDKIRKELEKTIYNVTDMQKAIQAGIRSADLLPTEKECPECENVGILLDGDECSNCNGSGTISLYYTPEQYEKIMDKSYPDDALVWYKYIEKWEWQTKEYLYVKHHPEHGILIVQTAQSAPPADYRPEE